MAELSNEEFYDREVAPALKALMERCNARGMAFVCDVGLADGSGAKGSTRVCPDGNGVAVAMTWMASAANGCADSLIAALVKHGKENGHNSVYLRLLETFRG